MAGVSSTSVVVLSEEKENITRASEQLSKEEDRIDESGEPEVEEENIPYLTGKPRFDVVLMPGNFPPRAQLSIPSKICKLLPHAPTPTVIKYENKTWDMLYRGQYLKPRFGVSEWSLFVKENELRVGDACVFELMKYSEEMIEFKVMILRCDIPPELVDYLNAGGTEDNPVEID